MKKFSLSLLLFQIFFCSVVMAQKAVVFEGESIIIGQHVSILEDATGKLSFVAAKASSGFVQSQAQVPNLQLSRSVFWLKFTIKNESPVEQLLLNVDYPTLHECQFYYPEGKSYNVETLGDKNPFSQRKYKHQNFIFDINIHKDSSSTFYLKVQSNEQMVLPLVIGTPQMIAESTLKRDMLWGILVGILLVMILYNTFVFASTKDVSYLYYVLYAFFIALTQTSLSGYTFRFLFPNNPVLFNMGIVVFNALGGIAFSMFAITFLGIKENMPKMVKFFKGIILLYVLTIVARVLDYPLVSYRMTDLSALVVTLCVYIVIIRLSIRGSRPARFFLLAWTMFFTGVVLFVLRNLGILPYSGYTNYTMPIGAALEVIMLSLALADRINTFKAEKEKSQEETVKVLLENEKIVREQNTVLELKVSERTIELSKSNTDLNSALENLKQTQSQLVDAEKMASLGQLTAGIAHEINNPINFVTSNINPLERDIEMVLAALPIIEKIALSGASSVDKAEQIKQYKEELDFDYLSDEIRHLMKGINEGAGRTAEIVKGLRLFSRLDEDELKRTDINEGLEATLVIANNLIGNRICVVKQYGELPVVEAYPGKLNQAFLNIISNAVYAIKQRFGEKPGGEIKVTTTRTTTEIMISVMDNGIGMNEAIRKKVFEPFFTTKDVGEGTGLGMSIAYNIIKKHNGSISVHSVPDEGTEFVIKIPV